MDQPRITVVVVIASTVGVRTSRPECSCTGAWLHADVADGAPTGYAACLCVTRGQQLPAGTQSERHGAKCHRDQPLPGGSRVTHAAGAARRTTAQWSDAVRGL